MQATQSMQLQPTSELRHTPSATIYTLLGVRSCCSVVVAQSTHMAPIGPDLRFLTTRTGSTTDMSSSG
jgi:hypothetical protein